MFLTARSVVPYLLERGALDAGPVVDGELLVVAAHRRCRNFEVRLGEQPGRFVKQVPDWEADSLAALEREAACYALAHHDLDLAPLAALLPGFHAYDPARAVLVLELVQPAESLGALHRRRDEFPPDLAARWGERLAVLHRATAGVAARLRGGAFPGALPPFLTAHRGDPRAVDREPSDAQRVLAAVRGDDEYRAALAALCAGWRHACLIHGDARWDNCLLHAVPAEAGGELAVKLVDWELADVGDPCWDVGAALESYLSAWVLSLPAEEALASEQLAARAGLPLARLQPALQALWHGYATAAGLKDEAARAFLARSLGYAAARMVQTAYEVARQRRQPLPRALALLQVSANVLADPDGARAELLGL
jgi:aminoglycoside phosphotransferase (APT) family kinase protein